LSSIPIFDGHNDTVLQISDGGRSFFERTENGHIDLLRAKAGGLIGGVFAIWIPDPFAVGATNASEVYSGMTEVLPPLELGFAQDFVLASFATLMRTVRASKGRMGIIRTVDDFDGNLKDGVFSVEVHLEGADSIDPNLDMLEWIYAAGFRSLGITWSRPNIFGHGVPIRVTGSADIGPGLTDRGKALVRACNDLGVVIDVSHLNEAGFWDVARISKHPLVASHSNAQALSPSVRNLADRQLDAIRNSDGIVAVNFHCGFLSPNCAVDAAATSLTAIADQIDYLTNRIGIDRVAFGSDFDGSTIPGDLRDSSGMPKLIDELRRRGYDDDALRKIGYENWIRVFRLTWMQ
jgi:membrane dipeptidase